LAVTQGVKYFDAQGVIYEQMLWSICTACSYTFLWAGTGNALWGV